ncbi:MAG: hypothetical protein KAJ48_00435, partial [Elusimicrobiales bacterium]|nr:hypothetical protein [Elusimicrobiales bacterium]
ADSALTANVILADNNQTITGIKTFTSSITVTGNAFSVGGSTLIAKYGNIGIGDTTPDYKLDVAGTMGIDENLTMTGSAANIVLGSNYLSGDGGDEGIFVNASGNVGIRTNNPGATLHISGGGSLKVSAVDNPWEPSITLATTNDVWKIYRIGSYLAFRNVYDYGSGVSDRLVIKGTGEVGIGDSTPDYKLDVAGTMGIDGNLTMTGSAANIILGSNYLSGDGGDEGIFVDASGNVGIGTTGPGQKLTVAGTIESTSGGIKFPDGATQITAGSILQTHVFSDYTSRTTASGAYYYFGGTEFANFITPKKADSIILISINYFGEANNHNVHVRLQYSINSGAWTDFDLVTFGQQGHLKLGDYPDSDYNSTPHNHSTQLAKAFVTTQPIAFRMLHFNTGTFYHNRSVDSTYESGPSTFVLQELDAQNSSYTKR